MFHWYLYIASPLLVAAPFIYKQEYCHLSKLTAPLHWVLYWCQKWSGDRRGSPQATVLCICVRPPAWCAAGADFILGSVCFKLYAKEARFLPVQRNCFHCWRMNHSEQWASLGSCVRLTISKYGTACSRNSHWKKWAGVAILIAEPQPQTKWAPGGVSYRTTNACWQSIPNLDCRAAPGDRE